MFLKIPKYTNTRNTKSSLKNTSGDHWCTCPFSPAPFSLCSSQTNTLLRAPRIQSEKNPLSYGVGKIYVLKGTQNLVWLFPKKYNPILEWILSAQEFSSWASPIFSKRVSYIFLFDCIVRLFKRQLRRFLTYTLIGQSSPYFCLSCQALFWWFVTCWEDNGGTF